MSSGSARQAFVTAPEPDYAVPPGETLRERLEDLGMSQAELAVRTGLTPKHINQVMQGVATLSSDVAQRLEYATGVSARLWNRLEADYRTHQSRLARERERAEDPEAEPWLASMPVAALVGIKAIPAQPSDTVSRLDQLLAFFGVVSISAWRKLWARPAAAFRQPYAYEALPGALAAWLRLGELAAQDMQVRGFNADRLQALLPELAELTRSSAPQAVARTRQLLADVGVALVLVPEVAGARAYGATRWLSGQLALVQLSLRGKTEDTLWITLFHELGHVLLHGRREVFVERDEGEDPDGQAQVDPGTGSADDPEREAQRFALDALFGTDGLARLEQIRTSAQALDLAEELNISPGIVASQLQARGVWSHEQGAQHRRTLPELEELLQPTAPKPARARKQTRGGGAPRLR
jgi:HTH-type transcriptional regulator/antitoxin HigA